MLRIGIIIREFTIDDINYYSIRHDITNHIKTSVIFIPIDAPYKHIINAINLCDAIILSGGNTLTKNDFKIVKYLYNHDIPTLGICLGMQAMGQYFNHRKEIEVSNHLSTNKYVHYINIKSNTLLHKILKTDRILVNSRHTQAIPNTKLTISALSDDGIIEAIEAANKTFFIGVQWHPESLSDIYSKRLFNALISTKKNTNY